MRVEVITVNTAVNNTCHVEYELIGDEWVAQRWRIGFNSERFPNGRLEGEWHKLDRRHTRPIAGLPLRTRTLDCYLRSSNRSVMVTEK